MPTADVVVVLITIVTLALLYRPPRIRVFLTTPGRLVRPLLGRLTLLDLGVVSTAAALFANRDNRRTNALAAHRLVALGFQIAVKVVQ